MSEIPPQFPNQAPTQQTPMNSAAPVAQEVVLPTSQLDSATAPASQTGSAVNPHAEAVRQGILAVRDEVAKVVVGQGAVVSGMLTALLVGGHVLLEGVPGTAKTLTVSALARALHLHRARVQFTPDLMPSDVLGQSVYDADAESLADSFRFRKGPVFTNLLLADEINRTPPRTQSALLEAMEERRVTIEGQPRDLPRPFMVIATQNPVEYEGTYPLPEAQLDRFLLKLIVGYPEREQERDVLARHDQGMNPHDLDSSGIQPVAGPAQIEAARQAVEQLRTDPTVLDYIVALTRATRTAPSLTLGVSPRGSTMLLRASKAWAWLSGRTFITPDDVKAMAIPVLRHRIQVRPDVELEGGDADRVLQSILASVPVPR